MKSNDQQFVIGLLLCFAAVIFVAFGFKQLGTTVVLSLICCAFLYLGYKAGQRKGKIDEIVDPKAFRQLDTLIAKLSKAGTLEKQLMRSERLSERVLRLEKENAELEQFANETLYSFAKSVDKNKLLEGQIGVLKNANQAMATVLEQVKKEKIDQLNKKAEEFVVGIGLSDHLTDGVVYYKWPIYNLDLSKKYEKLGYNNLVLTHDRKSKPEGRVVQEAFADLARYDPEFKKIWDKLNDRKNGKQDESPHAK